MRAGFLYMWGIVFLVTTTLVMIFKRENATPAITSSVPEDGEEPEQGIVDTYKLLFRIVRLPSVLSLISILLTVKVEQLLPCLTLILCEAWLIYSNFDD